MQSAIREPAGSSYLYRGSLQPQKILVRGSGCWSSWSLEKNDRAWKWPRLRNHLASANPDDKFRLVCVGDQFGSAMPLRCAICPMYHRKLSALRAYIGTTSRPFFCRAQPMPCLTIKLPTRERQTLSESFRAHGKRIELLVSARTGLRIAYSFTTLYRKNFTQILENWTGGRRLTEEANASDKLITLNFTCSINERSR